MTELSTDSALPPATEGDGDDLVQESVTLVRRWLAEARTYPTDPAAARLADLLRDPDGLGFAVGFVDRVVRPEDLRVSARALAELAPGVPKFLPLPLRAAVRAGGVLGPVMPQVVVPMRITCTPMPRSASLKAKVFCARSDCTKPYMNFSAVR